MANQKTKASQKLKIFYVTAPSTKVARKLAKTLLEERLIACANILPKMKSLYRWQGKVESSIECVLILKSKVSKSKTLTARILQLHPYSTPCIIGWEPSSVAEGYKAWLLSELV